MHKEFVRFFLKIFEHLARLALRHGLRFQEAQELLKRSFMQAALRELEVLGAKQNTSKLAAMTGLQRREVVRLLEVGESDSIDTDSSFLVRLLGLWQNGKAFTVTGGKPGVLPIEGAKGSFSHLVSSISGDLNPYTVLFELERLDLVKRETEGVRLLKEGLEVDKDVARGLDLLASDVVSLLSAVDQNLHERSETPNLHITTSYDNIAPDQVPTIRNWILEKGASFHRELRSYLACYDKDLNPKLAETKGRAKISVGTFSISEE